MASKPVYLPHSARQKYEHCPRLYFNHYRERLRPNELNSTLLFGIAIDGAAEEYLLTKNKELCRRKFRELWNEQTQDDKTIQISGSLDIKYAAADLDIELLTKSDNESILKIAPFASVSDLISVIKDEEVIKSEEELMAFSAANWFSMYRKGMLMLKGFVEWVDENVEEVLGTQVDIDLENEAGDKIPGKADFVIKIHGYDKPILVDLKSSVKYYERKSVKESEQLGLYFFYLKQTKFPDMERAAYLVLNKQIKKNRKKTCNKCGAVTTGREQTCAEGGKGKNRCNGDFSIDISPEAMVQYIHDEIPSQFIEDTIDKFNIVVAKIKDQQFEHCWDKCDNYYGRRCPFYDFCRTGSTEGLFKKEKKEIKNG